MKRTPSIRAAAFAIPSFLAFSLLLLLGGCEAIFTAGLLSFLQRDPAKMSAEQQEYWAEQALASGDPGAMAAAFAAIKDRAALSSDPELTYLAARLAMELSGASAMLTAVLSGTADYTVEADVEAVFATLNTAYLSEAAALYQATHANDATYLSGTDFVLGCMCLLFEAVDANGGDAGLPADYTMMKSFASAGKTAVGAGDPAYDILDELSSLVL